MERTPLSTLLPTKGITAGSATPTTNRASQSSESSSSGSGASQLTATEPEGLKDEFLRLLVAQLQQQDPLNPQDPSEFTAQLAQFSNLEQLIGINETLAAQSQLQNVAIGTAAASFVGQNAEVRGDTMNVTGGAANLARFNLAGSAASTQIKIYDSAGNLVKTNSLGALQGGSHDYRWDGLNDAGQPVADGEYRFEIAAASASGQTIAVETSVVGRISGVRFADGSVLLTIGSRTYSLGDLFGVGDNATGNGAASDQTETETETETPAI